MVAASVDPLDYRFGYLMGECPPLVAEAVARGLRTNRYPADSVRFNLWWRRTGMIDAAIFEAALAVLADSGVPPVADTTRLAAWDVADRMVQLSARPPILTRRRGPPVDSAGRCLEEGLGEYVSRAMSQAPPVIRPLAPEAASRLRAAMAAVAQRPGASTPLRHGLGFC